MSSLLFKLLMGKGAISEAIETFRLNLSNPSGGATLAKSFGTCTINQVGAVVAAFTTDRSSASDTGVSPFAVQFNASTSSAVALTSLPFHELYYLWSFGDAAGGATWSHGTNPGVASMNAANGPIAAHVFETAGTYTVTLTVYHLAPNNILNMASTTKTITVTDANTVFSGSNTICIANGTLPVAGVNGVPAGATCLNQSDWSTIVGYMQTGKRVLLKKGDAWTTAAAGNVSQPGPGILGAYGSGAKPLITIGGNYQILNFTAGKNEWRLMDLEFTGSESGASLADNDQKNGISASQANHITLLRCYFHNLYLTALVQYCESFSAFDSVFDTSFATYGNMVAFLYQSPIVALVGNSFSNSPITHTLRLSGTAQAVISNNTVTNPGPTRQVLTVRGWEAPTPFTQHVVVSDNKLSGGSGAGVAVYFGYVNAQTNEELRDVIFERNWVIGTTNDVAVTSRVSQNFTARNNIIDTQSNYAIELSGGNAAGAPVISSAYLYNNTLYKSSVVKSTFFSAILVGSGVSGAVIKNNLSYGAGNTKSGGQAGSGATFIEIGGTATSGDYTASNNSSDAQTNATKPWAAATPTVLIDYTPNSYAIDAGAYVPISIDLLGYNAAPNITATREIGAIQV